jgi:hypothetical protein
MLGYDFLKMILILLTPVFLQLNITNVHSTKQNLEMQIPLVLKFENNDLLLNNS